MSCQLGLDNSDERGGTYSGKGIGKTLGKIYIQLALDGYIDSDANGGPLISLQMSKKGIDKNHSTPFYPENPFLYELFGNDEDNRLDDISCAGVSGKLEGTCKKCPYLSG
jgi:hypothetical protein